MISERGTPAHKALGAPAGESGVVSLPGRAKSRLFDARDARRPRWSAVLDERAMFSTRGSDRGRGAMPKASICRRKGVVRSA